MYLPNQSKPVQRKRSYSVSNKAALITMSDEGMDEDDDDESEESADEESDSEMEGYSDDEGSDEQ